MVNITVVNRKDRIKGAIYCGRGSPLGNPFRMSTEADRDEVCEKYEHYFNEKVMAEGPFRNAVIDIYHRAKRGEHVKLECFCAPKRCHCDIIKRFIEQQLQD